MTPGSKPYSPQKRKRNQQMHPLRYKANMVKLKADNLLIQTGKPRKNPTLNKMATAHSSTKKSGKANSKKKWSAGVTNTSNALDLENNIFESTDPAKIASSLKHSAEKSRRRKTTPYQSAMSMLTFYINRAGKNLSSSQKKVLEKSKEKLRKAFGREPESKSS